MRPFCQQAGITQRSYSLPLQRALVDFGSDESFLDATRKVREHYGVELPVSAARERTLAHAKAIGATRHEAAPPAQTLVTSMDGSMIPIVESGCGPDQRKGKTLCWKQANLCCARSKDAVDCVYGATLASAQIAGIFWREVAEAAGLGARTYVHGVADGADPVYNVFVEQFGTDQQKAKFHLDFWHVSGYLVGAAVVIAPESQKAWLHEQQGLLLENKVAETLQALEVHFEPVEQEKGPVREAHHYMEKRKENMDYAGARAAGLPIGSGEVESGHRHVIQQRLKVAGAWWKLQNAEVMLQLRTTRANQDWDRYWRELAKN